MSGRNQLNRQYAIMIAQASAQENDMTRSRLYFFNHIKRSSLRAPFIHSNRFKLVQYQLPCSPSRDKLYKLRATFCRRGSRKLLHSDVIGFGVDLQRVCRVVCYRGGHDLLCRNQLELRVRLAAFAVNIADGVESSRLISSPFHVLILQWG